MDIEFITHVAIKLARDGIIHSLPKPKRHGNIIHVLTTRGYDKPIGGAHGDIQGFLTNTGRFVDRKEARLIAEKANQLIERDKGLEELYSEDIW